ncbi:MAG: hypothetical protein Fur006_57800 [Coleofasciculaceae cyanobacterium]
MNINFERNKVSYSGRSTAYNVIVHTNSYQQSQQISNTIISIQYNHADLVIFRIKNVQQGNIVYDDFKGAGLLCQINKKAYFFTRHHLEQMSDREQSELFAHLGIDGSRLFVR